MVYLGNAVEYLIQLLLLRPNMEQKYPGVKIYIACRNETFHILNGNERVLTYEELKASENNFVHIRELKCDMLNHPVEEFIEESGISMKINITPVTETSHRCVIIPNGDAPTQSMTPAQIDKCKAIAVRKRLSPEISTNIAGASLVIGVENELLFSAMARGIPTMLVPNGIGTNLYKKMAGNQGEILL